VHLAYLPNVLDNKEVFLHACATVAFALRAVADAVRTRTEKLPYYRVHSVLSANLSAACNGRKLFSTTVDSVCQNHRNHGLPALTVTEKCSSTTP
jgi:hypothetical protein